MNDSVIDASVIFAILKGETLDEIAFSLVDGGVMSAVNVAEIYSKLRELKIPMLRVDVLLATLDRIEPFTVEQARLVGGLREPTRHAGLSLGDRACLALALELDAVAYTTEHAWSRVDVGCRITILR